MDKIPLCRAALGDEERQAVLEVLASGWLTDGPKTRQLEQDVAAYLGVGHAVAMNSCTSALFLALKANDIRGEVLLPSFTFVASANAVATAGATPVFVDIDRRDGNLDPALLEASLSPRTEALMVVHYAGQCCRMDQVRDFVERHGLLLIEDSAETLGGTFQGRPSGSWGVGCFSFFPTKNITTGEGGMLTTNDERLARRVRTLVGHGIPKTTQERSQMPGWFRAAEEPGYNFRLSNLLAAIGVEQMKKLEGLNQARRDNAARLIEGLKGLEGLGLPRENPGCRHVYQMFTVTVPDSRRDQLVEHLRGQGIEASVHFDPPVHLHPAYAGQAHAPLPQTEWLSKHILTLPMYPHMGAPALERIIEAIGGFWGHA